MRLLRSITAPFAALWAHRRLLATTAWNDARTRYLGTALGFFWILLYPLLFLAIYGVVYSRIFLVQLDGVSTPQYIAIVFTGLVPFIGISEVLSNGTTAVTSNKGLVRNTLFPIEMIPAKVVLASSLSLGVGLLLMILYVFSQGLFLWTQLLIPVIAGLQVLLSIGVAWILSACNVFVPDLGQIMGIVILLLMIASPIAYTSDMVPDNIRTILGVNPLYYLITLYRDCAFYGYVGKEMLFGTTLAAIVVPRIGWALFTRLKPLFADHF
jgi:lipopolysaccharide transport system permease protein